MLVITQTYQVVGDTVYKYIGRLPDKDKSLLDEKIKRLPSSALSNNAVSKETLIESPRVRPKSRPSTQPILEKDIVSFSPRASSAQEFSLDLGQLGIPESAQVPTQMLESSSSPLALRTTLIRSVEPSTREDMLLEHLLSDITTNNFDDNITAIKQLEKLIIENPAKLIPITQEIISSCIMQIRSLCGLPAAANINKQCRHILHLIASVFGNSLLTTQIKRTVLFSTSEELLTRMHDPILVELDAFSSNPGNPNLSKNMSSVMIRIIESANKNLILR